MESTGSPVHVARYKSVKWATTCHRISEHLRHKTGEVVRAVAERSTEANIALTAAEQKSYPISRPPVLTSPEKPSKLQESPLNL
jgi:hypothetical protein